jgi:hypothetical protein
MRHIHPIQPILVIILIIVFIYLKRKSAPPSQGPGKGNKPGEPRSAVTRPVKPQEPPEVVFANLRRRALESTPESVGLSVGENEPYGAVMDMGIGDSVVTLACFADGDAGLYYQTGGGMKGGGAHENVRKAAKEFVALAEKALPLMIQIPGQASGLANSLPLPESGRVQFFVLTPRGAYAADMDREALGEQSEFSALFYSGQEVAAQMRQIQQQRAV